MGRLDVFSSESAPDLFGGADGGNGPPRAFPACATTGFTCSDPFAFAISAALDPEVTGASLVAVAPRDCVPGAPLSSDSGRRAVGAECISLVLGVRGSGRSRREWDVMTGVVIISAKEG
jgi:hypothetical protein